jgi:hypothetical protein
MLGMVAVEATIELVEINPVFNNDTDVIPPALRVLVLIFVTRALGKVDDVAKIDEADINPVLKRDEVVMPPDALRVFVLALVSIMY